MTSNPEEDSARISEDDALNELSSRLPMPSSATSVSEASSNSEVRILQKKIQELEKKLQRWTTWTGWFFNVLKLLTLGLIIYIIGKNAVHVWGNQNPQSINAYLAQNTTLILSLLAAVFNPSITEWFELITEALVKMVQAFNSNGRPPSSSDGEN